MCAKQLQFSDVAMTPMERAAKQPSYISGHRARLRDRFMQGGAEAMPDYELLEALLFKINPRGDTKPLAYALLKKFGDISSVMSAPPARLLEVPGVGRNTVIELKVMEAVAHRMARARIRDRQVISSWEALLTYCHTAMAHRDLEHFRVLYLDRRNTLIADEEQARGTVDHVPVYPREVVKRALELNASAVILVHNHPSGDPTPSAADIEMTNRICDAAQALSITVHDHLIVGKSDETSFRSEGLLPEPT